MEGSFAIARHAYFIKYLDMIHDWLILNEVIDHDDLPIHRSFVLGDACISDAAEIEAGTEGWRKLMAIDESHDVIDGLLVRPIAMEAGEVYLVRDVCDGIEAI